MLCSCCCWEGVGSDPEDLAGALVAWPEQGNHPGSSAWCRREEIATDFCLPAPWCLSMQEPLPLANPGELRAWWQNLTSCPPRTEIAEESNIFGDLVLISPCFFVCWVHWAFWCGYTEESKLVATLNSPPAGH